jgi:translation initiation factor 2 subunit 2
MTEIFQFDKEDNLNDDDLAQFDLSLKKKKKKKNNDNTINNNDNDNDNTINDNKEDNLNDDDLAQFDLSLKKKKKKKILENKEDFNEKNQEIEYEENQEYDYVFLLDRFFTKLRDKNPNLVVRKKQVIPPPILHKTGKKTMWSNFLIVVSILKRSVEHIQSFINYEMSTESSIDGNSRLLIKGKFNSKNLEKVLTNYIIQYVSCYMCKSTDTVLVKDSITRLSFVNCDTCKSSRSVNPIKKSCRI